ncbi:cyclic GMP-AMP synthase DncV-like nucleotidyltransferase [Robbsia sp. KACC 23696]|uniref:cyclic GMP-AMP synthase DncV-like nucleotidyltransferase n=1 Tax=Robbsia sp. KACC 23696 TaxID=3149231 RepID=UPI00325C2154
MFDCHKEMCNFHGEKVTLTGADRTEMRDRRNNGRTRLNTGLEREGHPLPNHHSQGSYAMHTMVQDDECAYDIDDGAYFKENDLNDANGNVISPAQAKERVRSALAQDQRLASEAEVHNNCVRQPYPQGYHIDIPVYRTLISRDADGNRKETYELASGDEWTVSDARQVSRWFKDQQANVGAHGKQLRKVVRLTKFYARSRRDWKEKTGSGILMTRLVCDEFVPVADRDDESLRETWAKIHSRLVLSLVVEHPVGDDPLAAEGDEKAAYLRDRLRDALKTLNVFDNFPTRREARQAWDDVFATDFFSKQPSPNDGGDNGSGKARFTVASESASDRRDDGETRYG